MSNRKKPTLPKHEVRVIRNTQRLEIRKTASGARTISGYFATFNTLSSDLGGFFERIRPGAFSDSLKNSGIDVMALYNHNSDMPLARVSNGSLTVSEDSKGLRFSLTLPKGVSYVDDLVSLLEQEVISACSFSFSVPQGGDDWEMIGDRLIRTLVSVQLYEGSIVGNPAYPNTVADLRSCPMSLRGKLSARDLGDGLDTDYSSLDSDGDDCEDDPDGVGCDDTGADWDDRSIHYRCAYRCQRCQQRSMSHASNLDEDDPMQAARSMQPTKRDPQLSEAEYQQIESKRCAFRCQRCLRDCHYPTAVAEDDVDARAHRELLRARSI
jgi:HK97 family phage prohead protease